MTEKEMLEKRVQMLVENLERAEKQLRGLRKTVADVASYASHVLYTKAYEKEVPRLSNKAWQERAMDLVRDLVKCDRKQYPNVDVVLATVYRILRDEYGVVIKQIRKDYQRNNDILRTPTVFEAISDDDTVRDIFDAVLKDLFPDEYFEDRALTMAYDTHFSVAGKDIHKKTRGRKKEDPKDVIDKVIKPIAIRNRDESFGFSETFERVCNATPCSWHNLQVRLQKKNGCKDLPTKIKVLEENPAALREFKKAAKRLAN